MEKKISEINIGDIVALGYRDAYCWYEGEDSEGFDDNIVCMALGEVVRFDNDNLILSFVKKEGKPETGLLIPIISIIEDVPTRKIFEVKKEVIGKTAGIFWKDISIFYDNKIPNESPKMYTEGVIENISDNYLTVSNPTTLKTKEGVVENHPKIQPLVYRIPRSLITNIEIHG